MDANGLTMPDRPHNRLPTHVFSSLRSRVWLLVALVTVPLFVDSVVIYADHRAEAIARVEQDFQLSIRSALVEEGYLVAHTRELLRVMANADETGEFDPAKCSDLARRLMQTQRDYLNFGAVLPDGTLFCSGLPMGRQVNFSDLGWFKEAVERKEMFRGHYGLGRLSGRNGIVFALPILGQDGKLRAVAYANTGLAWLERLLVANKLPAGWGAMIVAPDGKPAFQQPPAADERDTLLPAAALADLLQTRPAGGMRELAGPGGEAYLYGIAPLNSTGGEFHLAIGAPKAAVLADVHRDFRNRLMLLALAGILSIAIGQQAVQRFFVRWAERVHGGLRRFGAGECDFRFPENSGIREFREIDAALNQLFDAIEMAGHALQETRANLGLALECANLAVWDWHIPDGRKNCNARLAEMLGYRPDEFWRDAESWKQCVCPEDWPAVQAALQRHFDGVAPIYECEYRLRHKDGDWVWVLSRGRVVTRDDKGNPMRMAGTAMDITSRKVTELELRQRTEELVALLDAIPAPVWMARDPECREIVGNRAANQLYDMPSGSNLSLSSPDVTWQLPFRHYRADGVEYAADELPMQRAAAEARPLDNCEMRIATPGGRNIWLFGNAAPLFDDEAKVRGAVAAFVDITQLRRMDEALHRNEMVLAQAGKMAHLGAWSIEVGGVGDFRKRPAYWSDESFRLLGYEPGELTPTLGLLMRHVHPKDRQKVWHEAMRALAAKRAYQCRFRVIRRDGAERIFLGHGEYRFDQAGRPTHFIGACQDITEQKQGELELVRHRKQLENLVAERTYELAVAKEAAERAGRTKSQFLANISHELRTPLNSLMLLAHVLSDNGWGNLTPQQVEYARMIELSGNDLVHLIDELLDLAKIEAGRLDIQVRSVPFPDIMQNVQRIHRHAAQQKGLDFRMEIGADVPASILTDPLRLQQLLRNLLSNAIKFTYEGSVTLRIRRAVSGWGYGNPALGKAETVIAFDVIDTGIGVVADEQQRIFAAFEQFQNRPIREYGGAGLGLAISSEIAALLGGELALASVPRQGSTFTLYLPLSYLGPANLSAMPTETTSGGHAATTAAAEAPAPEVDPVLAGKTVLVVDDDQRNRFALAAMLEKQQMRVLTAPNGAEALDLLAREEADVVLMDVMMPVMDGYRTTRAIRSDLGRARLPVIALTADAMPSTREQCLAAGCSDYLSKPVGNSELLERLHKSLEPSLS